MKKTLLALASLFMTMSASADEVTFDFTGETAYDMTLLSGNTGSYNDDPYVCTEGSVTLTLNGKTRWWKTTGGNQLRFYKDSSFDVAVPEGNVVTSVVLDAKTPTDFSSTVGTYSDGTWTGSLNSVSISCTPANKNSAVSKVTVTYQKSDAPVKKNAGLSFSGTSFEVNLEDAFTAPTLTKATTADVTYSSSKPEVATVDAATGEVTLVARGTVEITATAAENDEYAAGSASYTIVVNSTKQDVVSLPYSETFESSLGDFVIKNEVLGEGLTYVWKHDADYKCAKASAYAKKNIPSGSYLASPWMVIPTGKKTILTFDQAINKYFGTLSEEAQLWIYNENASSTLLTITYPTIADGKTFSDFETQTVDLSAFAGTKILVAFKYESTDENAGTWEIKNFRVSADEETGIGQTAANSAVKSVEYFTLDGRKLVSPQQGVSVRKTTFADGKTVTDKVMKN